MSRTAATTIYASIASGMLALTGVVFSLVFVMVQFSASAYSPRIVLWVARSPLIAHSLGIFIATLLYAIAALAWIDRDGSDTVPILSAAFVIVLLLASIGALIALIERVALLSVTRMLTYTADQGRRVIESMYHTEGTRPAAIKNQAPGAPLTQTIVYDERPKAVQAVNVKMLVKHARKAGAVIEVVPAVGDTIGASAQLVRIFGAKETISERDVRRAIRLGPERTFEQDPKYAIRLLVDIAIRALSPAVNDPTTAVQALDQIGDLLMRLARRPLDVGAYHDEEEHLRVIMRQPEFEDFLRLSFDEILDYGAGSVQVMRRMRALVSDLAAEVSEGRQADVKSWVQRLDRAIARAFPNIEDQRDASIEDQQGLGVPRDRSAV
jgi:uncharacterized membrane protein